VASYNTVSNGNNRDQSIEEISVFSQNHLINNKRSHTRYFRQDIEVTIKARRLLERKYTQARLINITPHGASIISNKVMRENNRVLLKFSFEDGQAFVFRARVARRDKRPGLPPIYGVEFENRDALFKDKLLKTQLKSNLTKKFLKEAGESL